MAGKRGMIRVNRVTSGWRMAVKTRAMNTPMNTGMIREVAKKTSPMTMIRPSSSQAPIPPRTSHEGSVSRAAARALALAVFDGDPPRVVDDSSPT